MISLVQLRHSQQGRRIALVDGNMLCLLEHFPSAYALAWTAIESGKPIGMLPKEHLSPERLDYDAVYEGKLEWQVLPAFDHPEDLSRCLVSGTGLTHKASAARRAAMHQKEGGEKVITDSMRMFQWGMEGGKPAPGTIGI